MTDPGDDDYPAALAAFREAWTRLLAAMRASRHPQQWFDRTDEIRELRDKQRDELGNERSDAARAILAAERITLTELAKRISMTKQAAGRLRDRRKERQ